MAVRLVQKVKAAMHKRFSEMRYFRDSSAALGMLKVDSVSLLELVGTWVSEIPRPIQPRRGVVLGAD